VTIIPKPGIETYTTANSGLSGDDVTAVTVDAQDNKWFGTDGDGLSMLSPDGEWATYYPEENPTLDCTTVAVDASGNAWCGHKEGGGVSVRLADTTWETYTVEDGLSGDNVNDIAIDEEGRVWLATAPMWLDGPVGGGVSVLSGTTWITYTTANSGLTSNQVNDVAVDDGGRVWFATAPMWLDGPVGGGVSVLLAGGDWITYTAENSGLGEDYVQTIAVAPNGDVWFGHGESYSVASVRHADGSWETIAEVDVDFYEPRAIAVDASGNVWFGHYRGVSVRWAKDGGWKTFTTADGLVNAWVSDVVADRSGNVWCTHNEGEWTPGGVTVITQEATRKRSGRPG
jgi:ligand-binding sensor domain-containing protein